MNKPIELLLDKVTFIPIKYETTPAEIYATHEGILEIGEYKLRVYQLNNGKRVIEQHDLINFFNGGIIN